MRLITVLGVFISLVHDIAKEFNVPFLPIVVHGKVSPRHIFDVIIVDTDVHSYLSNSPGLPALKMRSEIYTLA